MEEKLYNLSKRVAEEKLSTKYMELKTRPHITLGYFNEEDVFIKRVIKYYVNQNNFP